MIEVCKKQECVGCGACLSACNRHAITMQPDSLGFLYPIIDQDKCVDCGLCTKSCFNNHKPVYNEPMQTCIGYASDINEQISSTSGGIASVLMRTVLSKGGIVYGCTGENARDVKHIRIERLDEIVKLKGSKYVQSYMGSTYKTVVNDLKADRTVLFIGTPCQVAGLKAYLKGKVFENLFTIDFVCHGVPSQQILNDAIDAELSSYGDLRLVNRVKGEGKESKYTLRLLEGEKVVYDDVYPSKGYITGFLCGLYYRENCYQCKFSKRERVSDITLGDFWDRQNIVHGLTNKKNGLSMIMVNTESGKNLLAISKDSFKSIAWSYDDFLIRNGQLKHPVKRHSNRDLFEKLYKSVGYNAALTNTIYNDLRKIRKNIILNKVVELINRIPIINLLYIKYKR